MKRGFSKTYRRELESDIWKMPPIYQRVFFFLRLKVKYKAELFPTKKRYGIWLNPGQWLTSINNIAAGVAWYEWGVEKAPNKKVIKDVLNWLKSNDMILIESNAYGTYIELLNWGIYNDRDLEKVTIDNQEEVTRRGHQNAQLVDTIKELNKELKELKELKEEPLAPSVKDASSPVVESLLLKDGTEYNLPVDLFDDFEIAYAAVDMVEQFKLMKVWCKTKPSKRKTKAGITRFMNTWLSRAVKDVKNNNQRAYENDPTRGAL